ncbi:MAG: hypothetical protein ACXWLG_11770 [Myxococcaceae bacterium]
MLTSIAVLCLLPALHPGDIQWVGDEPMLIAGALRADRGHVLAIHGLTGTAGAVYGPLPTWLYQLYLAFSSDLVTLVALRAVLTTLVVALSLLWLARTLGLWPWFIPALLCSPYLWFYGRAIWDNSFNIPLCALSFASAVSFLARGRPWTLVLSLACCVGMALTHLMALAFVVPVAGFLLVRAIPRLRSCWWQLLLFAAGATALSFPYLSFLQRSFASQPPVDRSLHDWLFPLLGARILTAQRIGDIFGAAWLASDASGWGRLVTLATIASLLAFPLVWLGMGLALIRAWHGLRSTAGDGERLQGKTALLLLLFVLGQAVVDGVTAKSGYTHYFNATWIAFALLAWLTVDALRRPVLRGAATGVLASSTLAVVLYLLVRIHHMGPAREPYGATLANQIDVARALNRQPPGSSLRVEVINVARFPIALRLLRTLYPAREPPLPPAALRLTYQTDDPLDGRIRLVGP